MVFAPDKSGTVYGSVTLSDNFTIPEGYTLTIPEDASLTIPTGVSLTIPSGVTVTNSGTITVESEGGQVNDGTLESDGAITGSGTITGDGTIEDTVSPTVEIKINDAHKWNSIQDNVDFVCFFKDKKTVTITATDNVTATPTIAYYLSDSALTKTQAQDSSITWTTYTEELRITAKNKKIIYARATDAAGNVTIVNSAGIVVYTDAEQDTAEMTYVKNVTGDVTAKVKLNGNTVAAVQNGSATLAKDTDYTADDSGTITLKDDYLKTLATADSPYTLTVSYHPMGEPYRQADGNDAPATTALALTVRNPKLIRVTAPQPITGVASGTEKTAAALGLPETVTIETEDTSVTTAEVAWNLTSLADLYKRRRKTTAAGAL